MAQPQTLEPSEHGLRGTEAINSDVRAVVKSQRVHVRVESVASAHESCEICVCGVPSTQVDVSTQHVSVATEEDDVKRHTAHVILLIAPAWGQRVERRGRNTSRRLLGSRQRRRRRDGGGHRDPWRWGGDALAWRRFEGQSGEGAGQGMGQIEMGYVEFDNPPTHEPVIATRESRDSSTLDLTTMATEAAVFAELQAALARENYTKAVEICNKIRGRNPEDQDAIKIKCVALIRLEKFDKALELAIKYPYLASERAYCLYRLKKDDEALALLSPKDASPAQRHLAAQLYFRRGDFEKAIEVYEALLTEAQEVEDLMELQTNLLAAYASAGRSRELTDREIPTDDSFEIAFNKSFIAIENCDWEQAEALLIEAEKLCRDVLQSEGASAVEIDGELAVIRTQLAFVKQMKGDLDGALSDYRNVLKLKLTNQAVGAVAANNIVSIRGDRDLFDSLKRLKNIESVATSDKLSPAQQEAVLANRALVLALMNKVDECRECVATLQSQFPQSRMLSEITVLLALKDQKPEEAIASLQSDLSLGGRLGLAHLYLAQGNAAEAAKVIDSIEPIAHTPGTVATLVALYEAAGQSEAAQQVLTRAVEHHKQLDFTSAGAMKIREGDCAHKIQKKQYQAAAEAYLELIEGESAAALDPELRLQSLASLVIALSFSDAEAAQLRCALLPPVPESEVDPVELEQQAARSSRLASKLADAGDKKNERKRAAKNPEQVARKRAKRREAHLEKLRSRPDYNASIGLINPDPERWIPKKQRSYSKRGRRGRNRFVGAQGAGMGTDKDAAKLDAAARAAKKAEAGEEKKAVVVSSESSAVLRKSKKKKRR